MNEEALKNMGQTMYETICEMFDDRGFHYERRDEDHIINCTVNGEDIPMDIIFHVRDERQIVQLISPMPFRVPEEKRMDVALAILVINDLLIDGSFDYDVTTGRIAFRLTACYIDSILGKGLFDYMLGVSAATIDEYNDKFLMIGKGMLPVEDFIENERRQ